MIICVFDTETVGKVSQDLLNVGYKIVDINMQNGTYETLVARDYLVGKLFNNTIYMINDDFVGAGKYGMYVGLLEQKKIIKRSIKQIFQTMKNDFEKHNVVFSYAYNNKFDVDKFEKTAEKFDLEMPFDKEKCFDIWAYATKYICQKEEYRDWSIENGNLTESKLYLSTSVEGVTRYLQNNMEFVEDHTALSDVHWELSILAECVKRGCDITRPTENYSRIYSDIDFNEKITLPNGEKIEIAYKRKFQRNGTITYK